MASKNTEAKQKEQELKVKAYLEDIKKVDRKHGLAFRPIIRQQEDGGLLPKMVVVEFSELEVDKK